jgi:hypothetical protein
MADVEFELLCTFETHAIDEICAILDRGFDVRSTIKGRPVITNLTEMYARSDAFPGCLRLLLERGATLDDPRIAPVLLDDADALAAVLRHDPFADRTSHVDDVRVYAARRGLVAACRRRVRQPGSTCKSSPRRTCDDEAWPPLPSTTLALPLSSRGR